MVVTTANVKADVGELWDSVYDGTTAVKSLIDRAEALVVLETGTTSGYDTIIRPLVDAMVVSHMAGGIDPVNKTIGSLSVGSKDLNLMHGSFMKEARMAAKIKGVSLDGLNIKMVDSQRV